MNSKLIFAIGFVTVSVTGQAQFSLIVSETPAGAVPQAQWLGIRRYGFTGTGSAEAAMSGIAPAQVSDPYGLALGPGGELFVGNRHGNSGPSSISRFTLDGGNNFVANGTITGNSLTSTHGIAFRPGTGDLYAVAAGAGMSVFAGGTYAAAGTLPISNQRDIVFNTTGTHFYSSQASGTMRYYDVGAASSSFFGVAGASSIHQIAWRGSELFAADFGSGQVFRIGLDGNGNMVSSTAVASHAGAIGLAFSPDGEEMFISSHTSGFIARYGRDVNTNLWSQTGTIQTGVNMGNLLVVPDAVPEPGTLIAAGAGLAFLARRRRAR